MERRLTASRSTWLKEVENDPEELRARKESDFLVYSDRQNFKLDFHALRHACGAWLIIAGLDAKTVHYATFDSDADIEHLRALIGGC